MDIHRNFWGASTGNARGGNGRTLAAIGNQDASGGASQVVFDTTRGQSTYLTYSADTKTVTTKNTGGTYTIFARSPTTHASRGGGKYYLEFVMSGENAAALAPCMGILTANCANATTFYWGASNAANNNCWGRGYNTAAVGTYLGVGITHITTDAKNVAPGDTVMIAVDFGAVNHNVWTGVNGTWDTYGGGTGNPAAGTFPTLNGNTINAEDYYAGCYVGNTTGNSYSVTMRTRAIDFAYSIPSGFTPWDQ